MLKNFSVFIFRRLIKISFFTLPVVLLLVLAQEYEADSCMMKDNTLRVCKNCRKSQWFINGRKESRIKYENTKRCSFKGKDETICCPDRHPTAFIEYMAKLQVEKKDPERMAFELSTMSPAAVHRTNTQHNSKLACEKYIKATASIMQTVVTLEVQGGDPSLLGEFPHMAAIGYTSQRVNENITWDCGGSLISERYILTAAHCVSDKNRPPFMIRLGKVTLNTNEDEAIPQDFGIQEIKMHPKYSAREKYNDIALIKITGKPIMDDKVRPACITFDEFQLGDATPVTATGFGIKNFTTQEKANELMKTRMQIMKAEKCNQALADNNRFTTRTLKNGLDAGQMCAHDPMAINDTCQGDSGGPLQINDGKMSYIVGITSFGDGCGSAIPSVYVRVSYYLNWIEDIVWAHGVNDE